MLKNLLIVLGITAFLGAQTPTTPGYTAADAFTASSGESLTVQLAANSPLSVAGTSISGSVDAVSKICFAWNGTAATSTALVISLANGSPFPTTTTAWKSSNVGTGAAGACFVLQVGAFSFNAAPNFYLWKRDGVPKSWGTTPWTAIQNFTATITPATGTVSGDLNMTWSQL